MEYNMVEIKNKEKDFPGGMTRIDGGIRGVTCATERGAREGTRRVGHDGDIHG